MSVQLHRIYYKNRLNCPCNYQGFTTAKMNLAQVSLRGLLRLTWVDIFLTSALSSLFTEHDSYTRKTEEITPSSFLL